MRIMSISRFHFLFLVTAIVLLKTGKCANASSSIECEDEWFMPYPTFPGCNDTLILCGEDSQIMENCCKCRCDAMDDPPNSDSCYTSPDVSPSPSPQDQPNGSNLPSDQTLLSVTSSPAPSMPTGPEPTPPPTNYYQNWQQNGGGAEDTPLFNRFIFIFFALFFPILFSLVMKKRNQLRTHRRHRRYRAARAERLRRAAMQQEGLSVMPNAADDAARYERIKSKFYFQQVLPDQSNVNAESLKGRASNDATRDGGGDDVERPSPSKKEDQPREKKIKEEATTEDAESIAEADAAEESLNQSASSIVHKTSQHHHPSLCEVISSWASVGPVPPPSDVCCICLEGYSCGETICVAKKPSCDHLFHKDCVLEWMKTNDECPLCRINLLY